jgi:hypothetical protein
MVIEIEVMPKVVRVMREVNSILAASSGVGQAAWGAIRLQGVRLELEAAIPRYNVMLIST